LRRIAARTFPIGGRFHRDLVADVAGGARAVLDDDLASEHFGRLLREQPREDVARSTGRASARIYSGNPDYSRLLGGRRYSD
jgi:hypothetical protein